MRRNASQLSVCNDTTGGIPLSIPSAQHTCWTPASSPSSRNFTDRTQPLTAVVRLSAPVWPVASAQGGKTRVAARTARRGEIDNSAIRGERDEAETRLLRSEIGGSRGRRNTTLIAKEKSAPWSHTRQLDKHRGTTARISSEREKRRWVRTTGICRC